MREWIILSNFLNLEDENEVLIELKIVKEVFDYIIRN